MESMIGYEFEFLVREGSKLLSKAKFLEFHNILQSRGWKAKYDPETGGLTGSTKDDVYITTDDGVGIMELNLPPTETVTQSDERLTSLLKELQTIYQTLGCSIIGTSVFPGEFDIWNPKCVDVCLREDCCEKSMIKYINAQRFHEAHHHWFMIAANHIWLDLPKDDAARHLWSFNRLSPILYALFSNGPIRNNAPAGILEWRDGAWLTAVEHSAIPHDLLFFGMYQKEYGSVFDYFDGILDSPPHFLSRSGRSYKVRDPRTTMRDLLFSEKTPALWGKDGGEFDAIPSVEDVIEIQHTSYPHARLKFFVRDGVTLENFRSAYVARDEKEFLNCFSKFCLEVRSVGAQKKGECSVAPAFVLGLQENIQNAHEMLDSHPYSFWKGLYDEVQKNGLSAEYEGVNVTEYAQKALDISYEGLKKRGMGEEVFLEPIRERIKQRQNPAQELLSVWEKEGMEGVYRLRDY